MNFHRIAADKIKENIDKSQLDITQNYVINMYYNTSPHMVDFYNDAIKNDTKNYGTHVGRLFYDKDQKDWIVEHNIHGDIYQDRYDDMLGGKSNPNKYGITSISTTKPTLRTWIRTIVNKFTKKKIGILFFIFILTCCITSFIITKDDPFITFIEDKPLLFTDKYDSKATLMIPAAYTNPDGTIQGEYRIAGKTYGTPSRKERISLHPQKGLVISGKWHSDYGFQQTVLIKNSKIRKHDDTKKRFRRALCTVDGQLAILQSKIPQTLNAFSQSLSRYCDNAVNLDTGDFGYGWYGRVRFSFLMFYNRHKQTNWLYIK